MIRLYHAGYAPRNARPVMAAEWAEAAKKNDPFAEIISLARLAIVNFGYRPADLTEEQTAVKNNIKRLRRYIHYRIKRYKSPSYVCPALRCYEKRNRKTVKL